MLAVPRVGLAVTGALVDPPTEIGASVGKYVSSSSEEGDLVFADFEVGDAE